MNNEITALSELLAANPAGTAFLRLGELLRQRGELHVADRVARRGLERHPRRADAHDLMARIAVDRGDVDRARTEWEEVLALSPNDAGAHKGLGFLAYRAGDWQRSLTHLLRALASSPADEAVTAAVQFIRAKLGDGARVSTPAPQNGTVTIPANEAPVTLRPLATRPTGARTLFDQVLGDSALAALLLDKDGYVMAGAHALEGGDDRSAMIGAQLSGVSDEAERAMRHLGLGAWRQIVFESDSACVAMAPAEDGVLLVATPRSVALGLVRRLLERSVARALQWLERGR